VAGPNCLRVVVDDEIDDILETASNGCVTHETVSGNDGGVLGKTVEERPQILRHQVGVAQGILVPTLHQLSPHPLENTAPVGFWNRIRGESPEDEGYKAR
jgi:hypothetical protein